MTRNDKLCCILGIMLLGVSIYIQFLAGFVGDKNWLLLAARMWVDGKILYRDIFEVNPPLIIWIYSLPVRLSELTYRIQDYQALVFMGLMAVALSISVCLRVIAFHPEFAGNQRRQAQFAFLLGFILIFRTNPGYFFDREHIFLVLILPYLLALLPSLRDISLPLMLRIGLAIMAGVGFCIKPHCAIVFAGIQLIMLIRERTLRILFTLENIIIGWIAASYLLLAWLIYPDYFSIVLPMAVKTYSGYGTLANSAFFLLIALFTFATTFVDFRMRFSSPFRKDIAYLLIACVFFLLYAFANNGWGYTYNPLISVLYLVTGWVMWDTAYLRQHYRENIMIAKRLMFVTRDCWISFAVNAGVVLTVYFQALSTTIQCSNTECYTNESLMKAMREQHDHTFGAISIAFNSWPTLVRMSDNRFKFETRFNHLWMLPAFFTKGPEFNQANEWIVRYVADAYADDLNTHRPEAIFVDTSPEFYITKKPVDLIAYLSQYDNFKAAWQHYHYSQRVDYCHARQPGNGQKKQSEMKSVCQYDVFERTGE